MEKNGGEVGFVTLYVFLLTGGVYLNQPSSFPSLIILGAFLLTCHVYLDPSLIILLPTGGVYLDRPTSFPLLIILGAFLLTGCVYLDQ